MPAVGANGRPAGGFETIERTGSLKFLGPSYKQDRMPGPAQAMQAGTLPVMQIGKHPAALLKMQPMSTPDG